MSTSDVGEVSDYPMCVGAKVFSIYLIFLGDAMARSIL